MFPLPTKLRCVLVCWLATFCLSCCPYGAGSNSAWLYGCTSTQSIRGVALYYRSEESEVALWQQTTG